jgi:hypothetical protein
VGWGRGWRGKSDIDLVWSLSSTEELLFDDHFAASNLVDSHTGAPNNQVLLVVATSLCMSDPAEWNAVNNASCRVIPDMVRKRVEAQHDTRDADGCGD